MTMTFINVIHKRFCLGHASPKVDVIIIIYHNFLANLIVNGGDIVHVICEILLWVILL